MSTKKFMWILIVLLLVVILTMIFLFRFNQQSSGCEIKDYSEIKALGVLNVAMEYNASDYYVRGDSIAGMQYELCKYISQKSGLELNITLENSLEKNINDLENLIIDVVARNIPITSENREKLNFTIPVTQNKQVLVQREKNLVNDSIYIKNQIELANKTVHLPKNSSAILRIKNLSEEIAEPIFIKEIEQYAQEQILYMVAMGEIDYAVIDLEIASKNQEKFPEIDMNIDISFTQLQAWATRKSSPILLDSLNTWIAEFQD